MPLWLHVRRRRATGVAGAAAGVGTTDEVVDAGLIEASWSGDVHGPGEGGPAGEGTGEADALGGGELVAAHVVATPSVGEGGLDEDTAGEAGEDGPGEDCPGVRGRCWLT